MVGQHVKLHGEGKIVIIFKKFYLVFLSLNSIGIYVLTKISWVNKFVTYHLTLQQCDLYLPYKIMSRTTPKTTIGFHNS